MTKILIVEDDVLIRDLMIFKLKKEKYDVIVADDGLKGVALAESEAPDLILMDMRLPLLDGWEATEKLKGSPQTGQIPIIALTAQSYSVVHEKWTDLRCDGYSAKPIHFPSLFDQIEVLIGNKNVIA